MTGKILLHIGKNPSKSRCRKISVACSKYNCVVFSEMGKNWKKSLGLYSKNSVYHLFPELGKIEKFIKS